MINSFIIKTLLLNLFIIASFGDYKTKEQRESANEEERKHRRNWEPIFFRSDSYSSDQTLKIINSIGWAMIVCSILVVFFFLF